MIHNMEELKELVVQGVTDFESYGHVNTQTYGDLILFNYNLFAQIEGKWSWFERVSRGLILNRITGEVVARPYDKFFNWSENHTPKPGRHNREIKAITEKVDGSLNILYRKDDEYKIATRGSFSSDQSRWGEELLHNKYNFKKINNNVIPNDTTLLFEIVVPQNRIVVDYGSEECLCLIGARNRHTGTHYGFEWRRAIAEQCGFRPPTSFDSLIEEANRSISYIEDYVKDWTWEQEGVVVEFSNGSFWKFKSPEYCRVHKILSTINFKNVLEAFKAGTLDDTLSLIPEHYQEEVNNIVRDIRDTVVMTRQGIQQWYHQATRELPWGFTRKQYAEWVMQYCPGMQHYMFARLDNKELLPLIFKHEFKNKNNKHLIGDE